MHAKGVHPGISLLISKVPLLPLSQTNDNKKSITSLQLEKKVEIVWH